MSAPGLIAKPLAPSGSLRDSVQYINRAVAEPEQVAASEHLEDASVDDQIRHMQLVAGQREDVEKPVVHIIVSAEKQLDPDSWKHLSKQMMDRLGYSNSPWVAVRHHNTEHDHIHIVGSRVDYNGVRVKDFQEVRRAIAAAQDLEVELGLTRGSLALESAPSMTRAQAAHFSRTGEVPPKVAIQAAIDAATSSKPHLTMAELADALDAAGIEMRLNVQSTGRVAGVSFRLGDTTVKGSALRGRRYTWNALQQVHGVRYDAKVDLPYLRDRLGDRVEELRKSVHQTDYPQLAERAARATSDSLTDRLQEVARQLPAELRPASQQPKLSPRPVQRAAAQPRAASSALPLSSATPSPSLHPRLEQYRAALPFSGNTARLRDAIEGLQPLRAIHPYLPQIYESPTRAARKLKDSIRTVGPTRTLRLLAVQPVAFGSTRSSMEGLAALEVAADAARAAKPVLDYRLALERSLELSHALGRLDSLERVTPRRPNIAERKVASTIANRDRIAQRLTKRLAQQLISISPAGRAQGSARKLTAPVRHLGQLKMLMSPTAAAAIPAAATTVGIKVVAHIKTKMDQTRQKVKELDEGQEL